MASLRRLLQVPSEVDEDIEHITILKAHAESVIPSVWGQDRRGNEGIHLSPNTCRRSVPMRHLWRAQLYEELSLLALRHCDRNRRRRSLGEIGRYRSTAHLGWGSDSMSTCHRTFTADRILPSTCPFHKLELHEIGELPVLPPLSVGEMTLRFYGALNYSPNRARDLRCALNGT